MKTHRVFFLAVMLLTLAVAGFSQAGTFVKRTTTKTDRFDFGSGGTVAINGAPNGSVTVQGWPKNEIEIVAEVEVQAANEADLAKIAELTGFVTDESPIKISILTVGGHNKFGAKKLPKDMPKTLTNLPFKINYTISVPKYCDLEIDGGKGDLFISGVEGSIRANFIESAARVEIVGGTTAVIVGSGSLDVSFGSRGWRGRSLRPAGRRRRYERQAALKPECRDRCFDPQDRFDREPDT
ncbi:MAG: hypothetical protein QM785_09115 [Pyrinomonadaceae bacterium]